jgi:hypothetical protein
LLGKIRATLVGGLSEDERTARIGRRLASGGGGAVDICVLGK